MKKYLVTGSGSGLGKYLYDELPDSVGLTRKTHGKIPSKYDTIIHCAFNKITPNTEEMYDYINDNLFLTKSLLEHFKYKYFIYISSIDVYKPIAEQTSYSTFKRYAEALVSHFPNTLILRLPVILGNTMKPNHLTRMINDKKPKLTLSSASTFNYILYKDVLELVEGEKDLLTGTYDLVAKDNVQLGEVAKELNKKVEFGSFVYITTNNFENPIYTNKTSLQTIKEFMR